MAGAGYKLFNTGDVLTAAQVNTYLQEQTVMVFADSAARTTALAGVLAEGMVTYLKDTNAIEKYTGAAWVNIDSGSTSPLTTKGDIYTYSTTDARLAVGANGESLVADSSTTTGLRWQGDFSAGKNKIINGDFGIWQRGTSFTNPTNYTYNSDRWVHNFDGSGATRVISRQTFTPGNEISGYEPTYFFRWAQTAAGSGGTYNQLLQKIEDVRTFAGQTVTFSFWIKASSNTTVGIALQQEFGSGGSSTVYSIGSNTFNITTSWQRYSYSFTVPSISGKTIGANSFLGATLNFVLNQIITYDIWGVQLEAGSVATAFQTATGTLAGELAACQRYYYRTGGNNTYQRHGLGFGKSATACDIIVNLPVVMRSNPSAVEFSTLATADGNGLNTAVTAITIDQSAPQVINLNVTATSITVNRPYSVISNNSNSAYLALTAEL